LQSARCGCGEHAGRAAQLGFFLFLALESPLRPVVRGERVVRERVREPVSLARPARRRRRDQRDARNLPGLDLVNDLQRAALADLLAVPKILGSAAPMVHAGRIDRAAGRREYAALLFR